MSAPQDPAAPKKKSSKLLVMALAAVLLAGGGGGGAWWWTHRGGDADDEEAAAHAAAAKKKHAKPLFTTLEPFTVNLADPRGERMAQIGITLQFSDPNFEAQLKDHLPAIRNAVLLLISSKQIDELLTVEGKTLLAGQVRTGAARAMGIDVSAADEVAAPEPAKAASAVAAHAAGEDADADEDEPKPKPKKKRKKAKPVVENPIEQVLFSQFIVQ